MRLVLQRVSQASVSIDGKVTGEIGRGFVALIGCTDSDTMEQAEKMAQKVAKLRVFPDADGKTNLSQQDIGGEILVISQFTLYADCAKGNRPSFTDAAPPKSAEELYRTFIECAKGKFKKVECGVFGASMKVELLNDGPFTVILE